MRLNFGDTEVVGSLFAKDGLAGNFNFGVMKVVFWARTAWQIWGDK